MVVMEQQERVVRVAQPELYTLVAQLVKTLQLQY
jgi:hypothetical protein